MVQFNTEGLSPEIKRNLAAARGAVKECGMGEESISILSDGSIRIQMDQAPQSAPAPDGHIYVVGFLHFIKIGWTGQTNPKNRIVGIQHSLPDEVVTYAVFPGSLEKEKEFHARFSQYQTRGEWFRNEGELAHWIAKFSKK